MFDDWKALLRDVMRRIGLTKRTKMKQVDIARIETELDVRLPADYAQALLNARANGWGLEIYCDAAEIIRQTKWNREEGFFGLEWPSNYLAIGDDGAGDVSFIDLSRGTSAVYFVDHEYAAVSDKWEISEVAASIAEWIVKVDRMQEELEAWWEKHESKYRG
jgi:hypothetical protein